MNDRTAHPISDGELDATLTNLAAQVAADDRHDPEVRLAAVRDRLFVDGTKAPAGRPSTLSPHTRSRRRTLIAGIACLTLAAGGAAAASGALDAIAHRGFVEFIQGGTAAVNKAAARVYAETPDGSGRFELWSAPTTNRLSTKVCLSLVTGSPGGPAPDKPWFPQAACDDAGDSPILRATRWEPAGSGDVRMIEYGLIPGATSVTFTDVAGHGVTAVAHDGYFIALVPVPSDGEDTHNGISFINSSGERHVIREPFAPSGEG